MSELIETLHALEVPEWFDKAGGAAALSAGTELTTMQINVGRACNIACAHCHLECGPNRTETMSHEVAQACVEVFKAGSFKIADITGGAPEMCDQTAFLIEELSGLGQVMVRTNLAILEEPGYEHFIDLYHRHKVTIIASLPCYTKEGVEGQRGIGVYDPCIRVLKKLNALGYGTDPELKLNLVYNPADPCLPPTQEALRGDYVDYLSEHHGIVFNDLYTICNSPLGRFGKRLVREGTLEDYVDKLVETFNPDTVPHVMCLFQISVGWDGKVYDCDGNQAVGIPTDAWEDIFQLQREGLKPRVIRTDVHCYACTAGHGSSCGGSLADSGEGGACCCCNG